MTNNKKYCDHTSSVFIRQYCNIFSTKHYNCHSCHRTFVRKFYRYRHIKEVHMNNSLNCNICHKSYSRKHDLKRHQEKEDPKPSTSISEPTPMDWDIPQSFYDLLDTLENVGLQMNNSSQSFNKSTQTTGGKINLAPLTRHVYTNTELKLSVDKSTNTELLIILEPHLYQPTTGLHRTLKK